MDCSKVGAIILRLRKEKGMTQKEIADKMNISDKTISKWERGLGCPDISLLSELSDILEINVENLLSGNLEPNDQNGGNMKKVKFYVCHHCNNIITSSSDADVSCCGRKLLPLEPQNTNENHMLNISEIEYEHYITINHDMTKQHYIWFISYVSDNRVMTVRLYPEQTLELRFPHMHGGSFYFYCSQDGLFKQNL